MVELTYTKVGKNWVCTDADGRSVKAPTKIMAKTQYYNIYVHNTESMVDDIVDITKYNINI